MGSVMDGDDAPPPYTPVDPLNSAAAINNSAVNVVSTQGNSDTTPPPNFISAAPYFRERSIPNTRREHHEPLQHTLTIYKRSKAKDYIRFPRCWRSDSEELTQHDWETFLSHLLPRHLGLAPHSHISEKERQRLDRTIESDEERRARVRAVVKEWNSNFFLPRGVRVVCNYVSENAVATAPPLCPKCYPSAARSIPLRSASSPAGPITSTNPANGQMAPRHQPSDANHPLSQEAHLPHQGQNQWNPMAGPHPGMASFMWNANKQIQNWASQLSENAAAYGKKAGEQAQHYGAMAQYNAQAQVDYVQQQIKYAESVAKSPYNHCSTAWGGQWGPGARWGAHPPRGRNAHWGWGHHHHHHNHNHHPHHWGSERAMSPKREPGPRLQRRGSTASSCSSSSSSSSSSDDSLCSLGSGKGNIDRAQITALRARIINLREGKVKELQTAPDFRSASNDLRNELRTLKSEHRNLRFATRHHGGHCNGYAFGREADKAESQATKRELRSFRQEYRDLARGFRQEKREIRRQNKGRRKERKKNRKEERKEQRRISKAQRKGQETGNINDSAALAIRLGSDSASSSQVDQAFQNAGGK